MAKGWKQNPFGKTKRQIFDCGLSSWVKTMITKGNARFYKGRLVSTKPVRRRLRGG